MPNYYIQATRGHFNPLSFDELVKPLNMYKEYYDENEKAITEMRSQADLWDEIMKSEGDTDLANKYNQYSQGLNDAAQQLSNGMSYNLRKQIQDLRVKSAMVKQIENAYTLRAKDIDTYNELMLKDPSRIGAFDPSQRSLNDYMRGPVTNEYGVSGDRLYSLGNARAKAMSAQRDKFADPVSALGKQYFELKQKKGFSDEEITQMLKDNNPTIFNEIDRIIQQEGTSLNNASDLNRAETYVLNGMLSGFTYDEDRKYMKNENFMSDYQQGLLAIKAANARNKVAQEEENDLKNYHAQLTGSLNYSLKNSIKESEVDDPIPFNNENGEIDKPKYNLNKDLFNGSIGNSRIITNERNNLSTQLISEIENAYNEYHELPNDGRFSLTEGNLSRNYEILKDFINATNLDNNDKKKALNEARELIQMSKYLEDVPGETMLDKYQNYVGYYNKIDKQSIHGWKYYDSSQNLNAINTVLKDILKTSTVSEYDNEKGTIGKPDESLKKNLLKDGKDIDVYPSALGLTAVTTEGDEKKMYVINSDDGDINVYNNNINALRELLNVELTKKKYNLAEKQNGFIKLTDNFLLKIENGKYILRNTNINPEFGVPDVEIPLYDATELLQLINEMVASQAQSLYDRAVPKKQESAADILNDLLNNE